MQMKKTQTALLGLSLITASSITSAATVEYGVYSGNDNTNAVFTITGDDVTEIAKVEGWDLPDEDASITSNGLTVVGTTPEDGDGENEYTGGNWSYSGTDSIEWLAIKFGNSYGLFEITDNDTSGTWDLSIFGGSTKISALSHVSAYGTVSAVPVPASAWLFMSGLLGLIGVSRRKQA